MFPVKESSALPVALRRSLLGDETFDEQSICNVTIPEILNHLKDKYLLFTLYEPIIWVLSLTLRLRRMRRKFGAQKSAASYIK